jgi:hypothetical protein
MHGRLGQLFGKYTEEMFFEGDQSPLNPMRYVPTPFHTKLAQERTALSQYIQQEATGTRMRRWDRPLHDFLLPYLRGAVARVTGEDIIPGEIQHRRDLDTLANMLKRPRPAPLPRHLPPSQSTPDLSGHESGNMHVYNKMQDVSRACSPLRTGTLAAHIDKCATAQNIKEKLRG